MNFVDEGQGHDLRHHQVIVQVSVARHLPLKTFIITIEGFEGPGSD